jgi:hypothetical protein
MESLQNLTKLLLRHIAVTRLDKCSNQVLEVIVKSFSLVPVVMCALLLLAGDVSGAWRANAQTTSAAVSAAAGQDGVQNTSAATASGNWQVSWTNKDGDAKQGSMQIAQDGSSLSGTFQAPRGSAKLTGSVQGSQVSIDVKAGGRGISFTGTLDGDKMSGTTAQGKPWTATRQ